MVLCRAALLQQADSPPGVGRGRTQHVKKLRLADVERARAADQDASAAKHLQGAQVQLLVAAQRGGHGALGLGEGGRVQDDGVVLAAGAGVVLQQVEGVGFDPLDLAARWWARLRCSFCSATSSAGRDESTAVTLGHARARCSAKPPW